MMLVPVGMRARLSSNIPKAFIPVANVGRVTTQEKGLSFCNSRT